MRPDAMDPQVLREITSVTMRMLLRLKGHGDQRRLLKAGIKQMTLLQGGQEEGDREIPIGLPNLESW